MWEAFVDRGQIDYPPWLIGAPVVPVKLVTIAEIRERYAPPIDEVPDAEAD